MKQRLAKKPLLFIVFDDFELLLVGIFDATDGKPSSIIYSCIFS